MPTASAASGRIILIDAPSSFPAADTLLAAAAGKCTTLMVRWGDGLDPFLLVPRIRTAGIEPGLALHFRDMNRTALAGVLLSASACGIRRILLVDPPPNPDAVPVGPSDAPAFLAWVAEASRLSGGRFAGIAFGACFLLDHPLDQRLFEKLRLVGLRFAAVPIEKIGQAAATGVEALAWIRPLGQELHSGSGPAPELLDLTALSGTSAQGRILSALP
ncbi:MAG TPA: hypothetical protein VIV61_17590 [Candidatus Ozemobacteraceae bacterium]